jgi:SOS-response transcriptional repressor LexA
MPFVALQQTPAGLPDGIFSSQKSQFWLLLEGLAMEDVGIFHGHLVHFPAVWYILWAFNIFCGIW